MDLCARRSLQGIHFRYRPPCRRRLTRRGQSERPGLSCFKLSTRQGRADRDLGLEFVFPGVEPVVDKRRKFGLAAHGAGEILIAGLPAW